MSTLLAAAGPSIQAVAATQSSEPSVDLSQHPSGIVPILQNIVATVNLSCKLDLKQIALRARNAEYNPKVAPCSTFCFARCIAEQWLKFHTSAVFELRQKELKQPCSAAFCCCHYPHQGPQDHCSGVCVWKDGECSECHCCQIPLIGARVVHTLSTDYCGKQVVTGAKSEQASLLAAKKVLAV